MIQLIAFIKHIKKSLKNYKKLSKEQQAMAECGWYILDLMMPVIQAEAMHYLQQRNIFAFNKVIVKQYQLDLNYIFNRLVTRHPERKIQFEEIRFNYDNGIYYTAIVNMLVQMEGISTNKKKSISTPLFEKSVLTGENLECGNQRFFLQTLSALAYLSDSV